MTDLPVALQEYLTVRRALGHKLEAVERLLGQFLDYYSESGATRLTTDLAVTWATLPKDASPAWWALRLGAVRGFASWLQAVEAGTEVPPKDVLAAKPRRAVPYLYTDDEVGRIIAAAWALRPELCRETYAALVGLLWVTGARVGEVIRLDRDDVDLGTGVVAIRQSKFGKSRELLLHPSSVAALHHYAVARDRLRPVPKTEAFFISLRGKRLVYETVWLGAPDVWAKGLEPTWGCGRIVAVGERAVVNVLQKPQQIGQIGAGSPRMLELDLWMWSILIDEVIRDGLGVEDQTASEIGRENTAQMAATRKKWSVRPHEPLIGMVILSVAFVNGSLSVDAGLRSRNQPPQADQITVTGSAEQAVTADTFEWDATVASTQPTTSAAPAQLKGWTAHIRTALDDAGAHDDEITFGSVVVQPNVQQTGAVTSFTESQTITVRSRRLPAMKQVLGVSNQLLAGNVPFIAQEPQYTFSGLKRLRPLLTAQATADARTCARAALGRNGHGGRSISISVGQFSVDSPGSVNIGSGDYNTSSIQQVVSVAVSATYSTSS